MSQEKVLHLLPSEVQLVVIVAFDCLSLIHRVIQRQKEFFEGFHYRWWHTQVNLRNAAQPGEEGVVVRERESPGSQSPFPVPTSPPLQACRHPKPNLSQDPTTPDIPPNLAIPFSLELHALPGLYRQDMVLHDVDVWVAPGLRGAVSWSPTPPSIGHVIATVVWVRAVLIPEGGGHKSQTQKEPELPLQNMDKGVRRGTRRIWSLTQGIKGTKERWVCGMTEARKQPAFSRSRAEA